MPAAVPGYQTVIPTGAGGISHTDRSYRQLMRFAYQREARPAAERFESDFGDVPALTFAARATASFPGAFPPVSIASVLEAVAPGKTGEDREAAYERIARHFVYGSGYSAAPAARQWFMDGGVLDNGPFDHVVDAIAAKRADGPTAREIIYLEPAPDAPAKAGPHAGPEPSFAGTVRASRAIPSHASLTAVLDELERMNATIAEVGAVVETLQPAVLEALSAAVPVALDGQAAYDSVTQSSAQVRAAARGLAGDLGYGTYNRLRAQTLAESFGVAIAADLGFPAQSNRSSFVAAALSAWARQQPSWTAADSQPLEDRLAPVDLPFRLRRAEFVLQGINGLFAGPGGESHADLVPVKQACWNLLEDLQAKQQTVASLVRDEASVLFGPQALRAAGDLASPDRFARDRAPELSRLYQACLDAVARVGVEGTSQDLWSALADRSRAWDAGVRAQLLARYVGFPIWDSLIFPIITLARLPQLTPITVHRFSPLDATCLRAVNADGTVKAGTPAAKLNGTSYEYFGAFFERGWRENDYLWGRLDGAELIMRLLSRQSGSDRDLTGPLRSALNNILDTERPQLNHIEPVWRALKQQVAEIADDSLRPR